MGPDYLQELAWQKKGNEMNTESLILSAFLSALTGLASIAVWILRDTRKALLDIVEKHFNHVTDEHIHCSQAKLESCKRVYTGDPDDEYGGGAGAVQDAIRVVAALRKKPR